MDYFNTDWKKLAGVTATSDSDIEKAFADQASGFVDNKLPALMQGDYQIGFEVVKKNDDNTRMVGVFAFKVEKSLLFAPVFFINGEIKGPLLYRTDTRTFVPANKEWASYLVSSLERKEGDPSSRSDRRKYPPLVRMDLINDVPGTQKRACAEGDFEVKVRVHKGYPHTIPNGTCTVKLDIDHPAEPATWNNRLPNGESVLKITNGGGCLACCCKEANWSYPPGMAQGEKHFLFTAKDAELFKQATPFSRSVAISDETGETWYEMGPLQANLVRQRFFSEEDQINKEASLDWNEIERIMDWPLQSEGLIHQFLLEPDYGKPAAEAIVKAADSNYEFAEMLATIYGKDNGYIPDHFNVTVKSASADTIGEVGIVNDISVFTKADEVLGEHMDVPQEFFKDGFFMYDTRMPDSKSVVYKSEESHITTPETAGLYSLVKDNGEWEDNVLVVPYQDDGVLHQWSPDWEDGEEEGEYRIHRRDGKGQPGKKIAYKDGRILCERYFLGMRTGDVDDADGLVTDMAPGNVYFMIIDGKASGPYVIAEKSEADGVHYWKLVDQGGWGVDHVYTDTASSGKEVVYNPHLDKSDLKHDIIGGDAQFIRIHTRRRDNERNREYASHSVALDRLEHIATGSSALTNFVFDRWQLPKVSITRKMDGGSKAVYQAEGLGEKSASMNKRSMMVKLAVDMRIDSEQAYRILDEADAYGKTEFIFEPHEKIASKLHLVDSPQFQDEFDPDQGVKISPVQTFRLGIHGDQTFEPASAIGDMVNPTSLTGLPNATVVSTDPKELRALADTYSLPNVFEHGVVGTLANTFNAVALVDKYVAKLEDGVDALGRIKFLLHWCPQDFERVYGSDDMVNMEAQVDANFTALGALLLDLLKKTEKQRTGQLDNEAADGEKTK